MYCCMPSPSAPLAYLCILCRPPARTARVSIVVDYTYFRHHRQKADREGERKHTPDAAAAAATDSNDDSDSDSTEE